MPSGPLALSPGLSVIPQIALPALAALVYARRVRALHERHPAQRPPRWRQVAFYAGLASLAAALRWLDADARELVWAHTLLAVVLTDATAPALALGLTAPLLEPLAWRSPRALAALWTSMPVRVLGHPLAALSLWVLDLYAWQLRALSEAARAHTGTRALEYACLLALALNMWTCLLGPRAAARSLTNGARLAYLLLGRLLAAVLGNVLLWSDGNLYPGFLSGQERFHVSPLADQGIAGAVLVLDQALVTLLVVWWLLARGAREARERRRLLEYARARGLSLSSVQAERLAAGRAGALRERLEALLEDSTQGGEPRAGAAQPPATAGRIVSSAPSATGVASPSRKRMSSPAR